MLRSVLLLSLLAAAPAAAQVETILTYPPGPPERAETLVVEIASVIPPAGNQGLCRVHGRIVAVRGVSTRNPGDDIAVGVPCGGARLERGPEPHRANPWVWKQALQEATRARVSFSRSGELSEFVVLDGRMIWQAPGAPL